MVQLVNLFQKIIKNIKKAIYNEIFIALIFSHNYYVYINPLFV